MDTTVAASPLQLWGAFCFGLVIGWFTYFVNRYRTGEVQLGDTLTLIGALGGGAILALFPARTDLFGAYGVGLACGFFSYLLILVVLVATSPHFTAEWFLDGRRKKLPDDFFIPAGDRPAPMGVEEEEVVQR